LTPPFTQVAPSGAGWPGQTSSSRAGAGRITRGAGTLETFVTGAVLTVFHRGSGFPLAISSEASFAYTTKVR
jgi:hypothetical protein